LPEGTEGEFLKVRKDSADKVDGELKMPIEQEARTNKRKARKRTLAIDEKQTITGKISLKKKK